MKQIIWISALAAALLLSGCSQQTKEDVKKAAESVSNDVAVQTKQVKEQGSKAMEEAKRQAAEALESAKESAKKMKEAAKAKAAEAAAAVEKKAAEIKEEISTPSAKAPEMPSEEAMIRPPKGQEKKTAAEAVPPVKNGSALYAKCAGCHGTDGKTKALGKSAVIAGQSAAELEQKLKEYKTGTRNVNGMGSLMKGQVSALSDTEIAALAQYISRMQ